MRYEDYRRQILKFAHQVLRRLRSMGVNHVDIDDVEQELAIAWVKARDSFDPKHGVPFRAYMVRGMRLEINRWVDRLGRHVEHSPRRLEETVGGSNSSGKDLTLGETIGGDFQDNELLFCKNITFEQSLKNLTATTQLFLQLLANPPKELEKAFLDIQAKAAFAAERGIKSSAPKQINSTIIFDLMGLNRTDRSKVRLELEKFVLGDK